MRCVFNSSARYSSTDQLITRWLCLMGRSSLRWKRKAKIYILMQVLQGSWVKENKFLPAFGFLSRKLPLLLWNLECRLALLPVGRSLFCKPGCVSNSTSSITFCDVMMYANQVYNPNCRFCQTAHQEK